MIDEENVTWQNAPMKLRQLEASLLGEGAMQQIAQASRPRPEQPRYLPQLPPVRPPMQMRIPSDGRTKRMIFQDALKIAQENSRVTEPNTPGLNIPV